MEIRLPHILHHLFRHLLAPALALLVAGMSVTAPASAEQLAWPRATALPKPVAQPNPPPAVLERAAIVAATRAAESDRIAARQCIDGRNCVICIAACDRKPPVVLQAMAPRPTHAIVAASGIENDNDGVSETAPRFARQEWAGIVCGLESGCRGSGIAPPRPREVHLTVITPYIGHPSEGTSHYIDR